MHQTLKYIFFFIAVVLLQVFLFDNLNLSIYLHPLIYISFIALLPMQTRAISTLLLGLLIGLSIDFLSGSAGLHTIASLASAFFRPYILTLVVGREEVKEGGQPTPGKIGMGKFLKYIVMIVMLHCLVFFFFESPSINYFPVTLVRIVLSSLLSAILVILSSMVIRRY